LDKYLSCIRTYIRSIFYPYLYPYHFLNKVQIIVKVNIKWR